jgi:hypothetical protein
MTRFVVHTQDTIVVYPNKNGAVVLRRERTWDEEHDTDIVIAREHAIRVAYAILNAAGFSDIQFYRAGGAMKPPDRGREPDQSKNRHSTDGPNDSANGADRPTLLQMAAA